MTKKCCVGYRKGDYLVHTDGGIIAYASECGRQYDGKLKLRDNVDPKHPQEYVKAKKDRQAVPIPRPIPEPRFVFKTDPSDL
jgi:hypothetical protein